ncbi:hypothetical protein NQ314_015450 [Rhamnusium bicolor]|uniref:Uncharacterized protein n=1 Tax=Rhamnusium bicolor TaxID=1586634 RepID=A0AAV8WYX6_9CUCU|nr:hypothetical protein NQ314_015450 [Rhamnusium bicolor]
MKTCSPICCCSVKSRTRWLFGNDSEKSSQRITPDTESTRKKPYDEHSAPSRRFCYCTVPHCPISVYPNPHSWTSTTTRMRRTMSSTSKLKERKANA